MLTKKEKNPEKPKKIKEVFGDRPIDYELKEVIWSTRKGILGNSKREDRVRKR